MRHQDEHKKEAVFEATVKLVNQIGFGASSVAKIAAEAAVSPATIYIYHKNKEDLLVSVYLEIKRRFSRAILEHFNPTLPIRDALRQLWSNAFSYIRRHQAHFQFGEQFAATPYTDLVSKEEIDTFFAPIYRLLHQGIEQKIIKPVSPKLLAVFIFHPVILLSNQKICRSFQCGEREIEDAFRMAWDAIRC